MRVILYVFICSLLIVTGQVLWKIALDANGGGINSKYNIGDNIFNLMTSPYMIGGIFIYILATIYWMYLIGEYEYSLIYPMFSMTYIISFVYASLLFDESISIYKILGVLLIIAGVVLIAKFG